MGTEGTKRLLLFTGDGKGKTTAALGMALRAAGHGMNVFVIQFVKSDKDTGEFAAIKNIPEIEIVQTGKGFVPDENSERFATHKESAVKGLEIAREALTSGKYQLVILDEICIAVSKKLVAQKDVIEAINNAAADSIIVLTGRYATEGLIAAADTVTEMKCVKHGYTQGIPAQRGVEN